ncbi:MAG: aldo/keto reductase [Verrucomicrobia bacterium]|nr:aldo/keto reductase [Verrucomicrobiota bacterium]
MNRRILGRTQLETSVMGLGCGGNSRLGQAYGNSESDSIRVVRTALDEGINFIDTAPTYGTEGIVGKALNGVNRDQYILSTKVSLPNPSRLGRWKDKRYFEKNLHQSLKHLKTDSIDIYNLHCVAASHYALAHDTYAEWLMKFQDQGKIRFLGITEVFGNDPTHEMLKLAVRDSVWDVIMVGLNIVNQSALRTIFPAALDKNLGIQIMFAVRKALVNQGGLKALIANLIEIGEVDPAEIESAEDPIGFLLRPEVAESLTDAAYRFCAHVSGSPIVLSGTGNPEHLRSNAASLNRPPLPNHVLARLKSIFGRVERATCN